MNVNAEREDDIVLYITVAQKLGINLYQMSAAELLSKTITGDAPRIESVCRIRRLLQKDFPGLRGKNTHVRKGYRNIKVKTELKEMKDEFRGQMDFTAASAIH